MPLFKHVSTFAFTFTLLLGAVSSQAQDAPPDELSVESTDSGDASSDADPAADPASADDDGDAPPPPVDAAPADSGSQDGAGADDGYSDGYEDYDTGGGTSGSDGDDGYGEREGGATPPPDTKAAGYPDDLFTNQMTWGIATNCIATFLPFGGCWGPFAGAYFISSEGEARGYKEDWVLPGLAGLGASIGTAIVAGLGLGIIAGVGGVAVGLVSTAVPELGFAGIIGMYILLIPLSIVGAILPQVAAGVTSTMLFEGRAEKVRGNRHVQAPAPGRPQTAARRGVEPAMAF